MEAHLEKEKKLTKRERSGLIMVLAILNKYTIHYRLNRRARSSEYACFWGKVKH